MSPTVSSSKNPINEFFEWFGDLGIFFWQVMRAAVTPPFEFRELFRPVSYTHLDVYKRQSVARGVILSTRTGGHLSSRYRSGVPADRETGGAGLGKIVRDLSLIHI